VNLTTVWINMKASLDCDRAVKSMWLFVFDDI